MSINYNKFKPELQRELKKCLKTGKSFSSNVQVRKPSMLKKIQRNRYQARSVYYFTDKPPTHIIQKKRKKSPFYFPPDAEDFSYRTKFKEERKAIREKAKSYKYINRPNYRTRLNENKLERLYVPTEITLPGKSITDNVDPEYFSIVAGKPIREKFNIKAYLRDLQSLFLIRLQIGYKYDETYYMEEQYLEEKKRLKEIQKKFHLYSDSYDKFLAEDHTSSLQLLKIADEEMKKSKMKREKIRNLLRDCGWYRTKILILDEQWRIARIFQTFLYQISPLWWRNKYDFIHKKDGTIHTSNTSLFGRHTAGSTDSVPSIISIIDQFIEDVAKLEKPMLYFEDPGELLQKFHELERNNLLALLQCEELTQPAQQMVQGLEKARQLFKQEVDILKEHLRLLENEVVFEENRSRECEQRAKSISLGLFRNLIVDKYTLNLYVNVEDCFEVCVAPNDSNLTLMMMMKGIEYKQESLMGTLDKLPNEIVMKALRTCYREDAKMMREAQEATKMIVQIENLMKTLRKSLEPQKQKPKARKLLWRSEPPVEKMEMQTQAKTLNKEQLEYLHFFTNYCATTNEQDLTKVLTATKSTLLNMFSN